MWTPEIAVNNDVILKEAAHTLQTFDWWPYWPGYTYNGMLEPLTSYNIAGAIWYQGEGNTNAPSTYARLLQQ